MKSRASISTLAVILLLITAGCASLEPAGHKYIMKGQVLEVTDNVAYLCIGSADGAKVGQEFTAYKFVRVPNPNSKSTLPYYVKKESGKVRIVEIVDEHYARAKVLSGEVMEHYVIELQ
jgi:hypothetical protein